MMLQMSMFLYDLNDILFIRKLELKMKVDAMYEASDKCCVFNLSKLKINEDVFYWFQSNIWPGGGGNWTLSELLKLRIEDPMDLSKSEGGRGRSSSGIMHSTFDLDFQKFLNEDFFLTISSGGGGGSSNMALLDEWKGIGGASGAVEQTADLAAGMVVEDLVGA